MAKLFHLRSCSLVQKDCLTFICNDGESISCIDRFVKVDSSKIREERSMFVLSIIGDLVYGGLMTESITVRSVMSSNRHVEGKLNICEGRKAPFLNRWQHTPLIFTSRNESTSSPESQSAQKSSSQLPKARLLSVQVFLVYNTRQLRKASSSRPARLVPRQSPNCCPKFLSFTDFQKLIKTNLCRFTSGGLSRITYSPSHAAFSFSISNNIILNGD